MFRVLLIMAPPYGREKSRGRLEYLRYLSRLSGCHCQVAAAEEGSQRAAACLPKSSTAWLT
jgi:hypothetical protein